MAIFHMQIMPVRRREGRRAVSAAAYRAGERLRDQGTGRLYNHARRQDVLHKEIVVPGTAAAIAPAWVRDRARLWNAAERAESGYHARPAREYQVALPAELGREAGVRLAQTFAHRLSERYGVAIDLAVHAPKGGGDSRNFHAHLLSTTRLITKEGLGAKTGLDLTARQRQSRRLPDHSQEYRNVRALWSDLTNEALRSAGLAARVDHRGLAEQGIGREPRPSLPIAAIYMERKGVRSRIADTLRRQYAERVARAPERAAWRAAAQGQAAQVSAFQGSGAGTAREVHGADSPPHPARRHEPTAQEVAPVLHISLHRPQVPLARSDGLSVRLSHDGGELRQEAERIRRAAVDCWRREHGITDQVAVARAAKDSGVSRQPPGWRTHPDPEQARREALQSWWRRRRQREAEEALDGQRRTVPELAPRLAWGLGL
jgi:hypothetical protein